MHPLIWQIQMVTEFTLRCTARMAEQPIQDLPFIEETFDQLSTRVESVIEAVDRMDNLLLDGSLERKQHIPIGEHGVNLQGHNYLTQFFLPNFFFHVTTAYAILRNVGLPIGKQDFVGDINPLILNNQ